MLKELKDKKLDAMRALRAVMCVETDPADRLEVVRNLIVCLDGFEELLEDMKIKQEPKYKIKGQIINRETGQPIPDDEPVFILRARDVTAVSTLTAYHKNAGDAGSPPEHLLAVEKRIEQFKKFSEEHPDRMKKPDTVLTDDWNKL